MQFVIVTGMSGAGKTSVAHILEDSGYYCIDNLPPTLLSNFASLCTSASLSMDKVALVVDARGGELISCLVEELDKLKKNGNRCKLLFLEATDESIIKRYKETRRRHPQAAEGRIEEGIARERDLLSDIRAHSDYVLDTSGLLTRQLKEQVLSLFEKNERFENISVNVVSFGVKYGIPVDSDLVFDVRFLPNPFYEPELKEHSGLEQAVQDFVLNTDESQRFLEKLEQMFLFLLPQYIKEGKTQLVVAIGCTGGKHRSVTVAEQLAKCLLEHQYFAVANHRDLRK